jgi:NAD(P)-dependent dehydrogenase (short-subunit alcohol dehydrogenase family)
MAFTALSKPLSGQVILITGAAGGIGASTASRLAKRGAQLVLCDLNEAALMTMATRLEGKHLTMSVDVTDLNSCQAVVDAAKQYFGRIDAVWANAGISAFAPFDLMEAEAWHQVININLLGTYNIIKTALPEVIATQGYIAMTASGASWAHSPSHSAYAASKAGIEALANSLRIELVDRGVDVGVFHPMWIRTPMVTQKQDHNAFNVYFDSLPAPLRMITEVDVLAAVLEQAFERREAKVIYPHFNWLMHGIRAFLPSKILTAPLRKIAPEIRRAFVQQMQKNAKHSADPMY